MQNTYKALDWLNGLKNKNQLTFQQFGITSFYPSITKELVHQAINFAQQFTQITEDDINININARQTFLFSSDEAWVKTNSEDFDVPGLELHKYYNRNTTKVLFYSYFKYLLL